MCNTFEKPITFCSPSIFFFYSFSAVGIDPLMHICVWWMRALWISSILRYLPVFKLLSAARQSIVKTVKVWVSVRFMVWWQEVISSPLLSRRGRRRNFGEHAEGDPSDHQRGSVQNGPPALRLHPPPELIRWGPQGQVDQGLGSERLRWSAEGTVGAGGQRQRGEGSVGLLLSQRSSVS